MITLLRFFSLIAGGLVLAGVIGVLLVAVGIWLTDHTWGQGK